MVTDGEIVKVLTESLQEVGELTLPASGASMGKAFREVDALVIRSRDSQAPVFGSVLVFSRNDRLLAHRIVWKFGGDRDPFCITKGDGLCSFDYPFVANDEVVGVVVGTRRDGMSRMFSRIDRVRAWAKGAAGLIVGVCAALLRRCR